MACTRTIRPSQRESPAVRSHKETIGMVCSSGSSIEACAHAVASIAARGMADFISRLSGRCSQEFVPRLRGRYQAASGPVMAAHRDVEAVVAGFALLDHPAAAFADEGQGAAF